MIWFVTLVFLAVAWTVLAMLLIAWAVSGEADNGSILLDERHPFDGPGIDLPDATAEAGRCHIAKHHKPHGGCDGSPSYTRCVMPPRIAQDAITAPRREGGPTAASARQDAAGDGVGDAIIIPFGTIEPWPEAIDAEKLSRSEAEADRGELTPIGEVMQRLRGDAASPAPTGGEGFGGGNVIGDIGGDW